MKILTEISTGCTLVVVLAACAYDPMAPDEYADFWCQSASIENSHAHQLKLERLSANQTSSIAIINDCEP